MAYFSKLIYTRSYKNRLQEAALRLVRELDAQSVESPADVLQFVEERVIRLNRSFSRCTALHPTLQKGYSGKDYSLYISYLATLTLYEVRGQFCPDGRGVKTVSPEAATPQLDLFTQLTS